jgi:hypothetical protein
MAKAGRDRVSHRARLRHYARCARFPRWITIPAVLILGLIFWIAALSDPAGHVPTPGPGSILYAVIVFALAALLASGTGPSSSTKRSGMPHTKVGVTVLRSKHT